MPPSVLFLTKPPVNVPGPDVCANNTAPARDRAAGRQSPCARLVEPTDGYMLLSLRGLPLPGRRGWGWQIALDDLVMFARITSTATCHATAGIATRPHPGTLQE